MPRFSLLNSISVHACSWKPEPQFNKKWQIFVILFNERTKSFHNRKKEGRREGGKEGKKEAKLGWFLKVGGFFHCYQEKLFIHLWNYWTTLAGTSLLKSQGPLLAQRKANLQNTAFKLQPESNYFLFLKSHIEWVQKYCKSGFTRGNALSFCLPSFCICFASIVGVPECSLSPVHVSHIYLLF